MWYGIAILIGFALVGCYTTPKQKGTWIVEVEKRVFYDSSLEPAECLGATIVRGPPLREPLPVTVFIVKPDMRCYEPHELDTSLARIKGTILSDFPIHPRTGRPVTHRTPDPNEGFSIPWVIRVKELEPL